MSTLKPYTSVLRKWDSKWGAKPTIKQLKDIHAAGLAREGSKTAFALAMLLREDGATQVQVKEALGATYRNRANQLCLLGLAKMRMRKDNGQVRYKLEIKTIGQLKRTLVEHEERVSA